MDKYKQNTNKNPANNITRITTSKELPKNIPNQKPKISKDNNPTSQLVNINFNLLRIILNFIPIDELLQILNMQNSKINKTFLEMNFLKIKNLFLKSLTKEFKIEDILKELYKILRKENLENKSNSLAIIKKAIKNDLLFEKIEDEFNNISISQNKDFWKYIFKLLLKETKQIKLQSQIVKNEDVENLANILRNNNSVFAISFSEDDLHKKLCAEFMEKSLITNFTITKIPYFIYKNNSITNEFHIGINELFIEVKNLDNKVKAFLKAFLSENKKYFINDFMKIVYVQFFPFNDDCNYNENENNKDDLVSDFKNKFIPYDKNLIVFENVIKNFPYVIREFDLYRILKAFAIVYNRHLFFGVYFYIDNIEANTNKDISSIQNQINNALNKQNKNLANSSSNKLISINNQYIKNASTKSIPIASNFTNNNTINNNNNFKNNSKQKTELLFDITLKNSESHIKLAKNSLKILLEITKLNFINLRYLDLKEIKLSDYLFRELLIKFNAPLLTHFILNNNFLTMDNLTDLNAEETKAKLSKLEVLNIDFNKINDKGFINLITKFPLGKIKELSLNVNEISAQNLGKNTTTLNFDSLRSLLLHQNKINDFGFFNILTKFKMQNLTELNLNRNEISAENLYKMPELTMNRLECLYLDENNIFDDGLVNVLKKIKMPRIKRLFFNNNQITAEYLLNEFNAAEPLNFKLLRILNFKKNKINDSGFGNILKLFKMPKLLELNFSENLIAAESLESVFAAADDAAENKNENACLSLDNEKLNFVDLKCLYFEGNSISDKGFNFILSSFSMPKIRKLQFNRNMITAENSDLIPKLNFKFLEYFFLAENKIAVKNLGNICNKITMPAISIFSIDANIAIDNDIYIDFDENADED